MPRYARFASHHRKARDTFAPTHRLSARHDKSRDQTDDKTENDQPNDVYDDYESPSDSDWRARPPSIRPEAAPVYSASVTIRVLSRARSAPDPSGPGVSRAGPHKLSRSVATAVSVHAAVRRGATIGDNRQEIVALVRPDGTRRRRRICGGV